MNFEIIDNAYQVTVLLICMLLSAWLGIRKKNRGFIMLSFGYGCFMMGTLFFVLYLAILGRVPQIFYTCEISWLAAYLFFLSLLLLRKESEPLSFSAIALIPAVIVAVVVLLFKIFGPAFFHALPVPLRSAQSPIWPAAAFCVTEKMVDEHPGSITVFSSVFSCNSASTLSPSL